MEWDNIQPASDGYFSLFSRMNKLFGQQGGNEWICAKTVNRGWAAYVVLKTPVDRAKMLGLLYGRPQRLVTDYTIPTRLFFGH